MAGPRSLSRSTKVAAPGTSGKKAKGKGNHQKKYSKKPTVLPTWDHDNSSGEDDSGDAEPAAAPASAAAAVTGKKRPRGGGGMGGDASSGAGSKSQRTVASGEGGGEEGDESGGSDGGKGSGREEEEEEEDGGAPAATATGGMGDVMARILGQKLDARVQAPVLAKRKTKAMKEMENASVKRAETRGKSAVRRANRTQQFVVPDHTTTDYERQLKKIATRGEPLPFLVVSFRLARGCHGCLVVVASGGGGPHDGRRAGVVFGASRHAFLDMLKTGVKPTGGSASAGGAAGPGAAAESRRKGGGGPSSLSGEAGGAGESGGRSWSVLKEDYMMGASTMKNWDQDSADSEADAVGGPNDMSEDDDDSD
ncbi:unnamed protein product [Scytosiphon promiscuus]